MSTTLANIGIVVPASGDSDYPTNISTSLTNLDNHDHTTGKGLAIGTAALSDGAVTTAKIADSAVTTAKIADFNVTRAKLVSVGQQVSASCANFSTNSSTLVDVTNLSVTITTTGRPVVVMLINDGSVNDSFLAAYQSTNVDTGPQAQFAILRDASVIARHGVVGFHSASGGDTEHISTVGCPVSAIHHIDVVAAGTYTYKLQARYSSFTVTSDMYAEVFYAKLVAFEL